MSIAASTRLLVALGAAIAAGGCDDGHEDHVSYVPGSVRLRATGETWPDLPCLARTDPRLGVFDRTCEWDEFAVVAGPREGASACNYRIRYTVREGPTCIVGRPLTDARGDARTSTLTRRADWSVS